MKRRLAIYVLLFVLCVVCWTAVLVLAANRVSGEGFVGRVTYYMDEGPTADSVHWTGPGVAACGYGFAFGTRVTLPDGSVVTCWDRIGRPLTLYDVDAWGRPDLPAAIAPYCWGPALNLCYVGVE